jgi:DNA-binding GntR family transcriptional regulator
VRTLIDPDAEWPHGREIHERGVSTATEDLKARLQLRSRVRLHWVVTELLDPGGQPAMLVTTWRRGYRQQPHATHRRELRLHVLTVEEVRLLGLVANTPAFLVERTRYDTAGRPVETADLVLPADR